MFISVIHVGENESSKLENPTTETVTGLMTALTSGNVAFFRLFGDKGYLTVVKGENNRVKVTYNDTQSSSDPEYQWGSVFDPTLMDDEREIQLNYGTETTPNQIYRTIPSEKALQIALYFLEHEVPPKGLSWKGRMDRFQ